ncbi:carbohydrate kinase family protein [Parabacteroides distasonis]|uniref:Carbohydrate kinase n=1 Tax=Parabacteroides distasonis TaxID=823 RepID=A0A3L7ZMD0_PARDI|nr:carbohydrate kinase [Parabacteroides distasonis]NBH89631.1 carbohydrate kinase [Parabacteroides distasonis]RLT72918.1 carbohydrate kinase [Parabacteroides distasonis]TGY57708.1 carbohydrate kinase [Parabacteroides distasonis]
MRKVFGIGETILDIIFRNDQPQKAVPGGSVFNGLISLGRLNVPVSFISELGNDRVGDMIRDFMEDNHITTEFVDRFPDGKSPISLAFLDDDKNANYIFYKDYPAQRLEVPLPKIEKDDIFVFGSYYSLNPVLRARMVEFLQYAQERKAIIYYDPNFRKAHAHEAIRLMPTVLENLEFADIVRGSDEDFQNLYGKTDAEKIYKEHIQFYCDRFLTTHGANGVNLHTRNFTRHFDSPQIQPLSTIGAGDNFNAGIVYGLLKYDVRHADLPSLDQETWEKIIRCGMDLASEVCQSYDNYISKEFAAKYVSQS